MTVSKDAHRWRLGFQSWLMGRPDYAPLRGFFAAKARDLRNPMAMRKIHLRAAIDMLMDAPANDLTVAAIDAFQREAMGVPPLPFAGSPDAAEAAATLKRDGYVMLPPIPAEIVAEMRRWVERAPLRKTDNGGPEPSLDAARAQSHVAHIDDISAINCPHLLEIATDPIRLGTAARYIGVTPTILYCTAWWSFAGRDAPKDAQLFHLDLDDHRFCKLFIYLTDVDEESGPHVFVPRTHTPEALLEGRARAPDPGAFDDWLLNKLRKTDEEVSAAFPQRPVAITGPAGTNFLAATRGLHRGFLPRRRDRQVCQIVYGASPWLQIDIDPPRIGTAATSNVPARLAEPPLAHVTRYVLRRDS